jgi:hypothetical protein
VKRWNPDSLYKESNCIPKSEFSRINSKREQTKLQSLGGGGDDDDDDDDISRYKRRESLWK